MWRWPWAGEGAQEPKPDEWGRSGNRTLKASLVPLVPFSRKTIVGTAAGKIGFWGVTPITQPAGAEQAAATLGNTDGAIGGLTISDPPTQLEVQALRDKSEELADDVRALSTLVHALRTALVGSGLIKGGA